MVPSGCTAITVFELAAAPTPAAITSPSGWMASPETDVSALIVLDHFTRVTGMPSEVETEW